MKPINAIYRGVMIALLAVIATGGIARAETGDKPRIDIYGFVQADFIYDFNRVDPAWNATLRPSKIPVGDAQVGKDGETIFSVRQSRFGANGYIPTDMGEVKTKFEFDMFGVGPDAGKTTIRLRHAYGEIGQFLAGQTNSLFMDGDVFPNTIDYWGPAGMIFFRNIQARWTFLNEKGKIAAVALEGPGAAIDAGQTNVIDPNLNVHSWNKYPDLTAHYRMEGDWGHFQAAGILRWLGYDTPDGSVSGHQTGWGLNFSGAIHSVGKDTVLVQVAYGEGIANYFNDGGVDLAPRSITGGAEALPILGLLLYYDKYWNDKWSSSIGFSETSQQNSGGQLPNAFHEGDYASVNLLHYPAKNVMVGGEFLWGRLEQNGAGSQTDSRIQFSSKFSF
jgi:hypothetical protein